MIRGNHSKRIAKGRAKLGTCLLNRSIRYLMKRISNFDMGKRKITEEGQPCWHCNAPVIKRIPSKKSRKGRAYYFEYYFRCSNVKCPAKFMYMPEEAKRFWSEKSEVERASPTPAQKSNVALVPPQEGFQQTSSYEDGATPPQPSLYDSE